MDGDRGRTETGVAWGADWEPEPEESLEENEPRLGMLLRTERLPAGSRHRLLSVMHTAPRGHAHLQDGDLVLKIGAVDTSSLSHDKLLSKMQRSAKQCLLIHRPGKCHDATAGRPPEAGDLDPNPAPGAAAAAASPRSSDASSPVLELIGRHGITMPTDLLISNAGRGGGGRRAAGVAAAETGDPEEARLVDRERSARKAVYRRVGELGGHGEMGGHGELGGHGEQLSPLSRLVTSDGEEAGGSERCAGSVEGESVSLVVYSGHTLHSRPAELALVARGGSETDRPACATCGARGRCVELLVDVEQGPSNEVVLERQCCPSHAAPQLSELVFRLQIDETNIVLWTTRDMCLAPRKRPSPHKAELRDKCTNSTIMVMYRYKSTVPCAAEPVVLGFSVSKQYLHCSLGDDNEVALTLKKSERDKLVQISANDAAWNFVFYRSEEPVTQRVSFESAAFPGWLICSQSGGSSSLRMHCGVARRSNKCFVQGRAPP